MSEVTYARGNGSFQPGDIAQLVAGLELALTNLGIKDRNDPTAILLAKLIIQLAIDGERDPTRLATRAMDNPSISVAAGTKKAAHDQAAFLGILDSAKPSVRGARLSEVVCTNVAQRIIFSRKKHRLNKWWEDLAAELP